MSRTAVLGSGLAALMMVAPLPAGAQTATPAQTAAPSRPVATATLDPVALQALRGMGAYLRTLKQFEIRSNATIENVVQDTNLKVTLGVEGFYRVQRPNAFFVSLKSDRQERQFYYDGKSFSVNVPRQDFYATVAAPGSMSEVVDMIADSYDIDLPLADLFYWAEADAPIDGIESAVRIGYAKVNGVDTDHFALRGADRDLQVWIARGARPLPARMIITSRWNGLSYAADLDWNTSAKFTPATFSFRPDAKASPIQLAQVSAQGN
jgi:hypothetical protein